MSLRTYQFFSKAKHVQREIAEGAFSALTKDHVGKYYLDKYCAFYSVNTGSYSECNQRRLQLSYANWKEGIIGAIDMIRTSWLEQNGQFDGSKGFYFDRQRGIGNGKFLRKPMDQQNPLANAVVPSNTDYFVGMIKSPEMPEAAAFVPTAISDVKAALPAAGMSMMHPPQISQTGEAVFKLSLTDSSRTSRNDTQSFLELQQ